MGFVSDIGDSISDAVSDAWDSAKDWGSEIAEAGRTFFDDPLEGVGDLVKTSFKPVEWLAVNPLKETWENKYGRMGMIAAGTYLTGGAMAGAGGAGATGAGTAAGTAAGATGTASAAGTASAGLSGTVAPVGSVVGAAAPSAAGGAAAGAAAGGSAAGSGGGMLSSAANWASNNQLLASTGLNMAGQGLSGYMTSRAAEEERKRRRRQELEDRNQQSAYGVTYDGTEDAGINTGGMLNEAIGNYRNPRPSPAQTTSVPQQQVQDPNAQQVPWWQRQGGNA